MTKNFRTKVLLLIAIFTLILIACSCIKEKECEANNTGTVTIYNNSNHIKKIAVISTHSGSMSGNYGEREVEPGTETVYVILASGEFKIKFYITANGVDYPFYYKNNLSVCEDFYIKYSDLKNSY